MGWIFLKVKLHYPFHSLQGRINMREGEEEEREFLKSCQVSTMRILLHKLIAVLCISKVLQTFFSIHQISSVNTVFASTQQAEPNNFKLYDWASVANKKIKVVRLLSFKWRQLKGKIWRKKSGEGTLELLRRLNFYFYFCLVSFSSEMKERKGGSDS